MAAFCLPFRLLFVDFRPFGCLLSPLWLPCWACCSLRSPLNIGFEIYGFGFLRGSVARNDRFGSFFSGIWKKPRAKRSFLEAFPLKFGRSLARNDHFGSFCFGIWKKLRTKRSFWKHLLWNLEGASHETIILEAFSLKFGGSLARNEHFGSFFFEIWKTPRTKRSFWKLFL